jgi:hypothetical protein
MNDEETALKEEMYAYAEHMLTASNRDDVFDEVVEILRQWDSKYTSLSERREAFYRVRRDARKCPSFHQDPVMRAYDKEAARHKDPVYDAYVKEWKKGK